MNHSLTTALGVLGVFPMVMAQGTIAPVRVKDLNPSGTSQTAGLHVGGPNSKTLFFSTLNGPSPVRYDLYGSDGTSDGTVILATGPNDLSVLAVSGTALYATESSTSLVQLLARDLVAGTTTRSTIKGQDWPAVFLGTDLILPLSTEYPLNMELFRFPNASAAGTMVKDITTGSSSPDDLCLHGTSVFFTASTAEHGRELWITDGTSAGTKLLKDIRGGAEGSNPRGLASAAGKVYFSASNVTGNAELWCSDGTLAGTNKVKEINPSATVGSDPKEFVAHNSKVYFTADNGSGGRELWMTDGTANGTKMVSDLATIGGADPHDLIVYRKQLWFFASDGRTRTERLYSTDGTAANTLAKISLPANGHGQKLTSCNGNLFYTVRTDLSGDLTETMWRTDGKQAATTRIVPALATNTYPFKGSPLTVMDNWLYFFADFDGSGRDLWKVK